MTPQERGDKIVRAIELMIHEYDYNNAVSLIAAQIEEAEREAIAKENWHESERIPVYMATGRSNAYEAGFSTARERARVIALTLTSSDDCDECGDAPQDVIADRIAEMEPESLSTEDIDKKDNNGK